MAAAPLPTAVRALLHVVARPEDVRQQACDLGVVRRQRSVDAWALVMTVVLAVAHRGPHSLAALRVALGEATGKDLARSSFFDRFTPAFEDLLTWLLTRMMRRSREEAPRPPGVLSVFRDVVAMDATTMKVHDDLQGLWRGSRRNTAKAAIKVHTWVRAMTGELLRYRITAGVFSDCLALGFGPDVRGVLFLFDMGYSSPSLWWRIHRLGGYFLTRLPSDRDPRILTSDRRHRGRARKLAGRKLREALDGLQRSVLDVDAEFNVHVRRYAKQTGRWKKHPFRVVALRNRRTGAYHVYVTNVPPAMLAAEVVGAVYRLRWEVETFFKAAKSGAGMAELPSRKPHVVRTLVLAALFRVTAAAAIRAQVRVPADRRLNPLAWLRHFIREADRILAELVDAVGDREAVQIVPARVLDPNRARVPTRALFTVGQESA